MAPKLILTGFMATGKSAVARAAARRLGWRLIDCDSVIAARAGRSIAEIFRLEGEASFRMLERQLVGELTCERPLCAQCGSPRPAVLALGGGTLVDPRNFERLGRAGVIVCLTARPEVIARRIGPAAASRPLLAHGGKSLAQRIAELLEARREIYARAPLMVDTSDLSVERVAALVVARFVEYGSRSWAISA